MNYERNIKYFKRDVRIPFKGWLFLIALIAGAFVFNPLAGVGALALIVVILVCLYGGKPSDAEIDAQFNTMFDGLKEQALKKLGLDEEEVKIAPPLFLKSYSFGKSVLGDRTNNAMCDKKGKDGYWRSPEVVLTAWFFTEDQIYHYVKVASLVSDAKKETTDEFFYKDVVSVKTDTLERRVTAPDGKEERQNITAFILRNMGGEVTEDACDNSDYADEAVRAMRNLLKQKKMA